MNNQKRQQQQLGQQLTQNLNMIKGKSQKKKEEVSVTIT